MGVFGEGPGEALFVRPPQHIFPKLICFDLHLQHFVHLGHEFAYCGH